MSEYDANDETDRGFRRHIRETKEEAFRARQVLRRELPDPSPETQVEVAAALSDFRDLLLDKSNSGALSASWDEYDVDWIEAALSETTKIERELERRGNPTESDTVPVAAVVDPHELIATGKRLDAIAEDLGWTAEAKSGSDGLYTVDDMGSDDYDDPIDDNVQKPV